MNSEFINRVEVLGTGELLLGLEGCGKPEYQYVYREAAGIYWDKDRLGFKSTPMKEFSCYQWFTRIAEVVRSEFGMELKLGTNITWLNVPQQQRIEIQNAF